MSIEYVSFGFYENSGFAEVYSDILEVMSSLLILRIACGRAQHIDGLEDDCKPHLQRKYKEVSFVMML